jgi:hypothetical protein
MHRYIRILLVAIAAGITGCASTDKPQQEERLSSIPWSKPESWQGQGQMGSMMQGMQGMR